MYRRTAFWLALLSSGLLPTHLWAQARSARPDDRSGFRRATDAKQRAARKADDDEALPAADDAEPAVDDAPVADFPSEAGQLWRTFDISRYTSLPHAAGSPQTSIVEWIFRRTGSAIWHGEKLAALSASRSQIRAYHSPKVLKQVEEIIDRFTKQEQTDVLKIRVRYVAAADPRWRYAVYGRLNPMGSGPQGQQIWTLKVEDAAMVRAQMGIYQGFKLLADKEIKLVNGQTLTVDTTEDVLYVAGPKRDSAAGLGVQPGAAQLKEGVVLRMSPLLNYEGDALDVAIDLKANTVKSLHRTKILAQREIGPPDMTIDVPEVVESRLNQTVTNWPLGQTLLISAGIHPGILQSKGGFLNLHIPGTVPSSTELLVFLDVETVNSAPRTARSRD
jgi:hypothetical protein